jgi:hypothetical protein
MKNPPRIDVAGFVWLRGLATTLTCSSMHLDLKHRYGEIGHNIGSILAMDMIAKKLRQASSYQICSRRFESSRPSQPVASPGPSPKERNRLDIAGL